MPLESEQFDDLARGRLHTALSLVGAITLGGDSLCYLLFLPMETKEYKPK
jgi:hypothetical protein